MLLIKRKDFESLEAMERFRENLLNSPGFVGGIWSSSDPAKGEYWVEWQDVWEMKLPAKLLGQSDD